MSRVSQNSNSVGTDQNSSRVGVILLNLGTPEKPEPKQVRSYLKQFLMDPYVIDIHPFLRWLLVHGIILRFRPKKSAEAYQKIWTYRGSPLLFHLLDLVQGVQAQLAEWRLREPSAPQVEVIPAMRYGQPSVESAFEECKKRGLKKVHLLPLYPQYSLAATESSLQEARRVQRENFPEIECAEWGDFFEDPFFIRPFADIARREMARFEWDHVLMSFHGLPERQVKKTDPTQRHCLASGTCCDRIQEVNRRCYRAQCFATARALTQALGLRSDQVSVCFQSRLGRTPWIQPYTDHLYQELPRRGIKKLAVLCPAFVSDCLETLEEIRIRGREDFIQAGGEDLHLVTSLNAEPVWIDSLAREIQARMQAEQIHSNPRASISREGRAEV